MEFVNVNEARAPIRVLRQVGPITNAELAEVLDAEAEFLRSAAREGRSWVGVVDVRRFDGATGDQREALYGWLIDQAVVLCETVAGVAFVCELEHDAHVAMMTAMLGRAAIPTALVRDLDSALDWALQQTYEMDELTDAELVLKGVDAFRPLMTPSSASSSSWSMSME